MYNVLYSYKYLITCTGYGDISAQNETEFIIIVVYVIVNMFFTAYVIGNMTLLVTQQYESIRLFRLKFAHLEQYMKSSRLPDVLRGTLRSYMILKV